MPTVYEWMIEKERKARVLAANPKACHNCEQNVCRCFCGHCQSNPCKDYENCDLWQSTNWDVYIGKRRITPTVLQGPRPAPMNGPDYERLILEDQDERYEG